jgi:hypothetical protein
MRHNSLALALALAALPTSLAYAQVRSPGIPSALIHGSNESVPTVTLPAPDVARAMQEDALRGDHPLRYGLLLDAAFSPADSGVWSTMPDGTRVWRLRLASPGAYSVGLEFAAFHLPQGAELYVYDEPHEPVLGAYTAINHQENGQFVIEPFPGSEALLELDLPPGADERSLALAVGTLIHDYRDVLRAIPVSGGGSGFGSCLIDVNCPQGAAWQNQKDATVRTLFGGGLCSGALINNTANDGTPYVLTANHCGQDGNTVFLFNYQKSGCGTGSAPTNQSVTGCTLLTTNSTYDNRLLRITASIPGSYQPYFAGWNRTTSNATFAFSMGHPSGGPKKISIDANGTASESTLWRVTWSEGTLEGGSSGGPLFDQVGRIKGPACCVDSFTCSQTAWFGRFDKFWTSNGIAAWLDPLGTGQTAIDGFDPDGGGGGGPNTTITSISPSSIPAVAPDGQSFTITGTNLDIVTGVTIDGIALTPFPPQWSVVGSTLMTCTMPLVTQLGAVDVTLLYPGGAVSSTITVVANEPPVLDLHNSDPNFLFNALGITLDLGSGPSELAFLAASTDQIPSVLPGLASYDIGNNFATFYYLGFSIIDATKGHTTLSFPISTPILIGTHVYFQFGAWNLLQGFPLQMSNWQGGTFLF